jgi:hypothetical protein
MSNLIFNRYVIKASLLGTKQSPDIQIRPVQFGDCLVSRNDELKEENIYTWQD